MNLKCLNGIISKRLAVHIDISSEDSWNLNSDLTSVSINEWKYAKSEDTNLLDFGLTAYDNGRVSDMSDSGSTTVDETKLTLYRVGNNTATGGTFFDSYPITPITGTSLGNYFDLTGGFLQGYFKLQGETYEALPKRYGEGITIETMIKIDNRLQTSIFYMMGARAEDKYNPYYGNQFINTGDTPTTGETQPIILTGDSYSVRVHGGESTIYSDVITGFTGRTTSEGNYYNAYIDTEVQRDAFPIFENQTKIVPIEQPRENTYDNVIAFLITAGGNLGVKKITSDGKVKNYYSDNIIDVLGWVDIMVSFVPDEIILQEDEEALKCEPRRKGTLTFYVDGRKFYELKDFDEFMFKDFKNHKEKVYGVPYNISWGGGSFGLKHSYHYTGFTGTSLTQDPAKQGLLIETNFDLPFIGGIQKLRIYDYGFNSQEALHNAYWESIGNSDYGITVTKGGRLIYQ